MIEIAGLVCLVLMLLALVVLSHRARRGSAIDLRPLPGMDGLAATVSRAAETALPIHLSVGVAGVGGAATAETCAGLGVLERVADEATRCGAPLLVTVADATVLPIAQDLLLQAYSRHGYAADYDPTAVCFIAPEPTAYAAGVMGLLVRQGLTSNMMIGSFGDEYLLMGEAGSRMGVHQVVGCADPRILPLVYASAEETLVGEEMYAAGPYLGRRPVQIGGLLAQDLARWVVIGAIILVTFAKLLG